MIDRGFVSSVTIKKIVDIQTDHVAQISTVVWKCRFRTIDCHWRYLQVFQFLRHQTERKMWNRKTTCPVRKLFCSYYFRFSILCRRLKNVVMKHFVSFLQTIEIWKFWNWFSNSWIEFANVAKFCILFSNDDSNFSKSIRNENSVAKKMMLCYHICKIRHNFCEIYWQNKFFAKNFSTKHSQIQFRINFYVL